MKHQILQQELIMMIKEEILQFFIVIFVLDCNGDDPKSSGRVGENLAYIL